MSHMVPQVVLAALAVVLFSGGRAYARECAPDESEPLGNALSDSFWSGWGGGASQTRQQSRSAAHLRLRDVPRLQLKWAFGFAGANRAFSQPAVSGGHLFVGSETGHVHSLGSETGCTHWTFVARAAVRTAMSIGSTERGLAIYFGDQAANVYALDAATGRLLWQTKVDDHAAAIITGAPTLHGDRLFVPVSSSESALAANGNYPCCTFRGSLVAVDAMSGAIVWKSHTIAEEPTATRRNKRGAQLSGPSGAAVWSAPVVDAHSGRVYVVTGNSYSDPAASTSDAFIAFDIATGNVEWSRQVTAGDAYTVDCDLPEAFQANCPEANGPDFDLVSPLLVELGGGRRALIAGQKSGVVHAVDPDRTGQILWQTRVGRGGRMGGIHWGIAADSRRVYVPLSDAAVGSPPADGVGAQPSLLGIPMMLDATQGGGLYAVDIRSGAIEWQIPHPGCGKTPSCSPAQSAAVTAIPEVVFSGGLDGHLRAYATDDGRILWDVDTAREFATVNGVEARGGSIDGPGPVIVDGTLYVNSGYMYTGHIPGNVLLAFTIDGK